MWLPADTRPLNALKNHQNVIQISNSVAVDRLTAVSLEAAVIIALIATAASLQLGKAYAGSTKDKVFRDF